MNKRQYCESRESIAYYSGLNGLEIKGIEYGIDDYIYCVSGAWGGGKAFHRCKIQYTRKGAAFFRVHGYSTQYIDLWVTILTVVDTVF